MLRLFQLSRRYWDRLTPTCTGALVVRRGLGTRRRRRACSCSVGDPGRRLPAAARKLVHVVGRIASQEPNAIPCRPGGSSRVAPRHTASTDVTVVLASHGRDNFSSSEGHPSAAAKFSRPVPNATLPEVLQQYAPRHAAELFSTSEATTHVFLPCRARIICAEAVGGFVSRPDKRRYAGRWADMRSHGERRRSQVTARISTIFRVGSCELPASQPAMRTPSTARSARSMVPPPRMRASAPPPS